jgi:hypothetical protein
MVFMLIAKPTPFDADFQYIVEYELQKGGAEA